MRVAVFADVHANLEALQAFLSHSENQQVEKYVFLGDIVGYGPNPNECVDILRNMKNLKAVMGNHDSAVIWQTSPYEMNKYARDAIFWTMEQLTKENIEFIQQLDHHFLASDTCFCHATPNKSARWSYLSSRGRAFMAFLGSPYRLSFVSHTHTPQIISQKKYWKINMEKALTGKEVQLDEDRRWIINCGSIGQPRDGMADGSYCLYDDDGKSVVFHRFCYDYDITAAKISAAGLPDYLGERLKTGR